MKKHDRQTDKRTNGQTNGQTNRQLQNLYEDDLTHLSGNNNYLS